MKKIIFTSGLPRSGSTLLSAILNQNPKFTSQITNPLLDIVSYIIETTNILGIDNSLLYPEKMKTFLYSVIDNYHNVSDKTVYFNHDRRWTTKISLLHDLYPDFKMIVCVRDIGWILDSFEILFQKNPYTFPSFLSKNENDNIYMRCNNMLNESHGVIGFPLVGIKQAIYSPYINNFLFINYDDFIKYPFENMKIIYSFIDEPYYEHDFENIYYKNDYMDTRLNAPGMHTVNKKIKYIKRESILPIDIWHRVNGMEVWKDVQSLNHGFTGYR